MTSLTSVDLAIFAIILISVVIGLFRGFIKEALSLCTWALAIWAGVLLHDTAAFWLANYIHNETVRSIAAFSMVFFIVLILGSLVTYAISLLVKKTGLSGTDRLLGIFFGLFRGVLLVSLALLVISYSALKSQPWWHDSMVIPSFQPLMAWLNDFVPENINRAKDAVLNKEHPDEMKKPSNVALMQIKDEI